MSLKSVAVEEYVAFSEFQSLAEFHHQLDLWSVICIVKLTKAERRALRRLILCSKKIPGVCHESIGSMVQFKQGEYMDDHISRDSFKRMIKKAKAIGILSVYETVRENGSQSSNLYVFHRYE